MRYSQGPDCGLARLANKQKKANSAMSHFKAMHQSSAIRLHWPALSKPITRLATPSRVFSPLAQSATVSPEIISPKPSCHIPLVLIQFSSEGKWVDATQCHCHMPYAICQTICQCWLLANLSPTARPRESAVLVGCHAAAWGTRQSNWVAAVASPPQMPLL